MTRSVRASTTAAATATLALLLLLPSAAFAEWRLGNGQDPASVTVAPGSGAIVVDAFTLLDDNFYGTETITAVSLAMANADRVSLVELLNDAGAVLASAVNPPNTVGLSVNITQGYWDYTKTYRLRITPRTHAELPLPPGTEYGVTAVVAGVTSSVRVRGRDWGSATVTIDNLSPGAVTGVLGTEGDRAVDLAWTNPAVADLAGVLVLRRAGSAPTEAPIEGASYTPGTTFPGGTSTVVATSLATALADTGLVNKTAYYYRLWARDSRGNYAATSAAIGPLVPDIVTIVGEGASEPAGGSVCPGAAAIDLDAFTLRTTSGTDTVTSVTAGFDAGTSAGVGSVSVVGTVTNGTLSNPGDVATIPLNPTISVDTSADPFRLRVTPRSHVSMPAPPGATYAVRAKVTALGHTSTTQYVRYQDAASGTVTVDNQSTARPDLETAVAGDQHVALTWKLPGDADFVELILLRSTAPISTPPAEGVTYAVGATIGGAQVVYRGTGTGLDDTGLANFVGYYYALYARDACGNWSLGSDAGPLTPRPSTIVGEGSDPAPVTVCPGTPAVDVDGFTLRTSQSTDSVSAVQLQLSAGTGAYLARLSIHDAGGAELGGLAPSADLVTVPLGTPLALGTSALAFRVRVAPKAGGELPPPPGGSYAVTARVVGLTQSAPHNLEFLDAASGTVTIANTHPRNPGWGTVAAGDSRLGLAWTNGPDANVTSVVILRGTSPVVDWPAEGVSYTRGDAVGASTVAVASAATPASPGSFLDTGLVNWTGYHYAAFAGDSCGNTSSGAYGGPWTPVPNSTVTGTVSVTARTCSEVEVAAAFTADANGNGTTTIRRGAAPAGPFDTLVCAAVGGPSPRTCTDTTAPVEAQVYYQATFADPDGVAGTNPVVSGGTTPRCAYVLTLSAGTPMPPAATVPAGTAGQEVARVKLSASQETITLASLGVRNGSTASPALPGVDVLALQLVEVLSGQVIATASYDGTRWRFGDLALQIVAGVDRTFAVKVSLATGAVPGRTFQPSIASADAAVAWPDAVTGSVAGSLFTIGLGPTEGLPVENTPAPMVLLQSPIDGATVTTPFRIQAQVYSPTANGLGDVTSVQLSLNGGVAWESGPFVLNVNYPVGPRAGLYEVTRTPAPGTYALRVRATNASGTVESGTSVIVVNDPAVKAGDGKLVVRDNSSQLCSDCHAVQTHSSQTAAPSSTGLSRYGSWSNSCRDCHTPHNTRNVFLVKERISPPSVATYVPSKDVTFLDKTTGDAPGSFVSSADRTGPCQACHTRTSETSNPDLPRWRRDGDAGGHYAGTETQRCTDCHWHSRGFQAFESTGGYVCGNCHSNQWKKMIDGPAAAPFRHKMGVDVWDSTALDWDNPLTTATVAQRSCVNSCHQDHVHNDPVTKTQHAYNVHEDASTEAARAVTRDASGFITGGTPTRTDFTYVVDTDGTILKQGACLSCHRNQIDESRPPLSAKEYAGSAHDSTTSQYLGNGYSWQYDLHDGSTFARNCTKCHAGVTESAPAAKMTSGVHYSENQHFLTGSLHPAGNPAGFVCYNCHGNGSVGNRYTDKDVYTEAAKTYGHPVNDEAGTHDTLGENFTVWGSGEFSGANRHASCMDCHLPHTAGKTRHDANDATVDAQPNRNAVGPGSTLLGATGVDYADWTALAAWQLPGQAQLVRKAPAVKEYQNCFKCHTSWAWGASAPPVAQPSLGGSGEQMTDVAQDYNPKNKSFHPVVTGLSSVGSGSSLLTAAQVTALWDTNLGTQTMYCSDCHGAETTAAVQGPHGSGVKFVLKGPNTRWPLDASGNPFTLASGIAGSGLFCLNCHPVPQTTANKGHNQKHWAYQCVGCHTRLPHGGKLGRLMVTPAAPARYRMDPTDGMKLLGFKKAASYTAYGKTSCAATCGGGHVTTTTGYETW